MRHFFFFAFLFCITFPVASHAIEAEFDTLIPYPRELEAVGAPVSLGGFQILIGPSDEATIGASEINQRIASLGIVALSTRELSSEGGLPKGNLIILATCDAPIAALKLMPGEAVTAEKPGVQGYVIRSEKLDDGSLRIWMVGSDAIGTLYAAVTARQLIQPDGKGSIAFHSANITDWPDYKKRLLGHPMSEPRRGLWYALRSFESRGETEKAREAAVQWVERKKEHYDWMLRAKINWAWSHSFLKAGKLSGNTDILRNALKEVNDYGTKRGIRTMVTGTTSVGDFPADKDNPDFKDVAYHSSHHRYFCWSRLDYHRKKAEITARMVADCGFRGYYLHAADGGGWRNPGLWNDRCKKCRETYGDDHAKADSIVFGIYYDAIRKLVPDCDFAAVVYPYSPEQLDPELVYEDAAKELGPGDEAREIAEKRTGELVDFVKQLDKLLPADIFVTVREAERSALDKMRAAWGKRRFHMYYEFAYWKGWQPYFTTAPLWTKSLYYPDYDDMLYGSMSGYGWREAMELLGAECAWNVNHPGSKNFTEAAWKELGTRLTPPSERAQFALRASRFWFGDKMGPLIAPAFAENISMGFIANPDKTLELTDIDDPLVTMMGQAEASRRATISLNKAWALQQSESILQGEDLGFFLNMHLMMHGAAITADHRALMMKVQLAINQGEREKCAALLTVARKKLEIASLQWQKLYDSADKKQLMIHYTRRRNPHGYLSYLDVSEFEKEVDELSANYEQRITERSLPTWFIRGIDHRRVRVARSDGALQIDGKLDEKTWVSAQPASNFIHQQGVRLESNETQIRLAFDQTSLYVAFECKQPAEDEQVTFAIAKNKGATGSRQWRIARDGALTTAQFPINKKEGAWKSVAKVASLTGDNIWSVEMAIPLSELEVIVRAGRSCVMQFVRQSKSETVTYGFVHGEALKTLKHFVLADFLESKTSLTPTQVGLNMDAPNFRHETIGTGAGTVISGGLSLLSDRPLHQIKVSVSVSDGLRLLGEHTFAKQKQIPLIWRPESRFMMRFSEEVPGVAVHFVVTADEGEWHFTRRFGSPRRVDKVPEDLFVAGIGEGQALNSPIYFPSSGPNETPWSEGTIEFWLKPNWQSEARAEGPRGSLEHAFVHMGPIRPDHPTLSNVNSLALVHNASGYLSATLASSRYRHRSANANIRDWKPGEWHHVAMQWKLIDDNKGGGTTVQIYLDGQLASKETLASPKETAAEALKRSKFRPPIQIGAMNTGVRPADAAIDELRISSVRRYTKTFKPGKHLKKDDKTLSLFHFEGNLDAEGLKPLKAAVGAAQ